MTDRTGFILLRSHVILDDQVVRALNLHAHLVETITVAYKKDFQWASQRLAHLLTLLFECANE